VVHDQIVVPTSKVVSATKGGPPQAYPLL